MSKTDHPYGIPRGTIEEGAFDILRNGTPHSHDNDLNQRTIQIAMMHSIAISLMRIADHLAGVENAKD